ncbi:hypothetical protein BJY04DRAFT_227084 [Aspergillus karnatakaensis]|uniref:uncharacterized protein n=1 Tax=Aspergillus karnatakaensis TaxID=1810916 RepID=UPI003CCD6A1D
MTPIPVHGLAPPQTRIEPRERPLAIDLFIELLSYQLASPVRWAETQQQLLQNDLCIRRFVEIGPQAVLSTMAKRSTIIDSKAHPSSTWLKREFLSCREHHSEILYQYDSTTVSESVSQTLSTASIDKLTSRPSHPQHHLTPMEDTLLSSVPSASIPLSASHIVLVLTAKKLRRRFDQVSDNRTIRDLCGGKSTLQNELAGDLIIEFGRVPDGVEDKPLLTLAEIFQADFRGEPGKAMSSLISRFMSSKMPAGFNQSALQTYLNSRWGVDKLHSIVPLCFATTMEPASRLGSEDEARAYLDDVVSQYATFHGMTLVPLNRTINTCDTRSLAVPDAVTAEEPVSCHSQINQGQTGKATRFPHLDADSPTEGSAVAAHPISEQDTVSLLNSELGEHFIMGIKPLFNTKKARDYNSWWNWSREELVRLLNEISAIPSIVGVPHIEERMQSLLNRWDQSCYDIVQARLNQIVACSDVPIGRVHLILEEISSLGRQTLSLDPLFVHGQPPLGPQTTITDAGNIEYREVPRQLTHYPEAIACFPRLGEGVCEGPLVHIKTRRGIEGWKYDPKTTSLYHAMLDVGVTTGLTYANKSVLITGAGPYSIAARIVQGLLSGGAKIIVTTSTITSESAPFYQQMYRQYGAKGASLTLLPFNQASKQDCERLVEHLYGASSPIGGDLDYIIPFAAISQTGELGSLGSHQELALRAMLINTLRLIGLVRREKERRRIETRPTMVILPMSCNEGIFGGDGFYSESKIGLRTLFNRFYSESWSRYVTICGAVIGWTRGTSLMQSSNIVAEDVERLGVITFTQAEMAFNILALMTPGLTALAENAPIYADLTGGMGSLWNIKDQIAAIRRRLFYKQKLQSVIAEEDLRHQALLGHTSEQQRDYGLQRNIRRARLALPFPPLPNLGESHPDLGGMIDLSRVVVVVGYSELGPWGSARTRWEMEHQGEFSMEGAIELAWMMGLIEHVDGQLNGEPYVGWIDAETQTAIQDDQVLRKYHKHIMDHAGLRLIRPNNQDSYDPSRKEFLQEIAIEEDMAPFEASSSTSEALKLRHGDRVTLQPILDTDNYRVRIRKGAVLMVPKAVPCDQIIAGRIPDGWDPARYGIPEDIVQQVDVTTLYALCCVSEAFLSAGIKDPYEIYQHIHVSELANCLGSGGGPMKVIQSMYRDRYLDRQLSGDIILEHFINTMGAWVNMLLLSAAGPLKTPVGACATAIESLDIGCEAIHSGKSKVAIVGGCDDYREELAYEFANIKATANSTEELAKGRTAADVSRPTASSRSGFAESAGCGAQILMSAELAIEMGLPIYGIVAYTHTASDQIGRSIAAPGKGILTAARETGQARHSPLLDFAFRRAAFDHEVAEINTKIDRQRSGDSNVRIRQAQHGWGNDIRRLDPSVSPIRASLATWGLTIDDISVVSMHGTSTKANEVNEGDVINTQMEHLGRQKGNPLLSVCQKSLTGHPKAAAGAWQLNGCLQMLQENVVPGNRNADNIDEQLQQFEHLVYPMESMKVPEIKATLLTSFGFGQKGALTLIVSPKYLFTSLQGSTYEDYGARVTKRQRSAKPAFVFRLLKKKLVQVKTQPPWKDPEAMRDFLLDPTSRVVNGQISHESEKVYMPPQTIPTDNNQHSESVSENIQGMLKLMTATPSSNASIGVDVEDINNINIDNTTFINRNFTPAEQEYCSRAPDPRASFAGRWSAKEAVFKSLQTTSAGPGVAMKEIEIITNAGIPEVVVSTSFAFKFTTNQYISSMVTLRRLQPSRKSAQLRSRSVTATTQRSH